VARTRRPTRTHGPQVFPRGRYYAADLRRWKGGRPTLRDPKHPGWPDEGEQTQFLDVAERWALAYVDYYEDALHRRQRGKAPRGQALGLAVERYMRHRERLMEANTLQADRTALGHLVAWIGADEVTSSITTATVQEWFDARLDDHYKPSTLERYRLSMSAFFRHTGPHVPTDGVVLPKPEGRDARPWTDAEMVRLRAAADELGEPFRAYLELGAATGARYSELIALRYEDFDVQRKTVRIVRQSATGGSRTKGTKGDRARTALVLPGWWPHHTQAEGRIVTAKRPMQRIVELAGVQAPGVLNHSLRHLYARLCVERGVPLEVLQKYLGHSSIVTTEREYGWMRQEVAAEIGLRVFYG